MECRCIVQTLCRFTCVQVIKFDPSLTKMCISETQDSSAMKNYNYTTSGISSSSPSLRAWKEKKQLYHDHLGTTPNFIYLFFNMPSIFKCCCKTLITLKNKLPRTGNIFPRSLSTAPRNGAVSALIVKRHSLKNMVIYTVI